MSALLHWAWLALRFVVDVAGAFLLLGAIVFLLSAWGMARGEDEPEDDA